MAVQASSTKQHQVGTQVVTWAALANGDTGAPVFQPALPNRVMQVSGTFGVGGSVTLKGSIDGVNYYVLRDDAGVAIAVTAAGMVQVGDHASYVMPEVTAGDGSTALTVSLLGTDKK